MRHLSTKAQRRGRPGFHSEDFSGLMVCAIFFVSGIVIGTFSARTLDTAETWALYNSISGYLSQIADGTYISPGFLSVLWSTGRYHLLILFLGFSLLGVLCLPIVSGMRGFYLSFSIAAFLRAFGTEGWPVAFSLFGVGALITVPSFFLLASQSFTASAHLGRAVWGTSKVHARTLYHRGYLIRAAICFVGLLAAAAIELYVTPAFVVWTSSFL